MTAISLARHLALLTEEVRQHIFQTDHTAFGITPVTFNLSSAWSVWKCYWGNMVMEDSL